MHKANIFLIDLNTSVTASRALHEILVSCPKFRVKHNQELGLVRKDALSETTLARLISNGRPDLLLFVISPNQYKNAGSLVRALKSDFSYLPIILASDSCKPDELFSLLKLGAADFITSPYQKVDILPRLWRVLEQEHREQSLNHAHKEKLGLKLLVGESDVFLKQINKIPLVARSDASVLIVGETGTGKDLFARAIHYLSPRSAKAFIPFDCGAVPTDLMENELFGHVQGAFTGAAASQPGLIQSANGGTLLLDDVDCLPLTAQAKLLRFLQEKEYRQLGSAKLCRADVRFIFATNADLRQAVDGGKLRQDLYYRLNVVPIMLPPLRERLNDVQILARHFSKKYAMEFDKQTQAFSFNAMQKLILYDWPGNVRELEHVVERAVLFADSPIIREADIFLQHQNQETRLASFKEAKARVVNKFERDYLKNILLAYNGNITHAAEAAQKNRRAFWQLIRKHRIDVQKFKTG